MTCPTGEKLLFLKKLFLVHVNRFMIFDMFDDIFSLFILLYGFNFFILYSYKCL